MKVVVINEEQSNRDFIKWIKENFDSELDYYKSILEFKGLDFLNLQEGFLGFRFSVKKYFIWAMNMFNIKEISVDRKRHLVVYATQDRKLIIEFSYNEVRNNKLDSLRLKVKDMYSGGTLINTYYNFKQLMQDALEIVADILVEQFPNKFNLFYTRDSKGHLLVDVPEVA